MKPLEFKIEEIENNDLLGYALVFYFEDGSNKKIYLPYRTLDTIKGQGPDVVKYLGLELNKHYSIADIYGYKVKDDREGL